MERIWCILIGYLFGLFQTGYLYGRMKGLDIRNQGSGNSGTTNALRVMGKKAGAIVFLGDLLKYWAAVFLTMHLFSGGVLHTAAGELLALYTGIGVVLGHNYPFYLNFKGGKGIAVTAALVAAMDLRITLVCLILFVGAVLITRYVSAGSILVVTSFFLMWCYLGATGRLAISGSPYFTESCAVVFFWAALAVWRHRANIRRLLAGTENKLF